MFDYVLAWTFLPIVVFLLGIFSCIGMYILEKRRSRHKYKKGDAVRSRVSTGSGGMPIRYTVCRRKHFKSHSHSFYTLESDDRNGEEGWFMEDSIEPYDPTPIPHPGERDA